MKLRTLAAAGLSAAALIGPAPVAADTSCPDVQVVFARGTFEAPGVGATGAERRDATRAETLQHVLEDSLYRASSWLDLPSAELRAVVVQDELHGALRHRGKATRAGWSVKQSATCTGARKRLTLLDLRRHI